MGMKNMLRVLLVVLIAIGIRTAKCQVNTESIVDEASSTIFNDPVVSETEYIGEEGTTRLSGSLKEEIQNINTERAVRIKDFIHSTLDGDDFTSASTVSTTLHTETISYIDDKLNYAQQQESQENTTETSENPISTTYFAGQLDNKNESYNSVTERNKEMDVIGAIYSTEDTDFNEVNLNSDNDEILEEKTNDLYHQIQEEDKISTNEESSEVTNESIKENTENPILQKEILHEDTVKENNNNNNKEANYVTEGATSTTFNRKDVNIDQNDKNSVSLTSTTRLSLDYHLSTLIDTPTTERDDAFKQKEININENTLPDSTRIVSTTLKIFDEENNFVSESTDSSNISNREQTTTNHINTPAINMEENLRVQEEHTVLDKDTDYNNIASYMSTTTDSGFSIIFNNFNGEMVTSKETFGDTSDTDSDIALTSYFQNVRLSTVVDVTNQETNLITESSDVTEVSNSQLYDEISTDFPTTSVLDNTPFHQFDGDNLHNENNTNEEDIESIEKSTHTLLGSTSISDNAISNDYVDVISTTNTLPKIDEDASTESTTTIIDVWLAEENYTKRALDENILATTMTLDSNELNSNGNERSNNDVVTTTTKPSNTEILDITSSFVPNILELTTVINEKQTFVTSTSSDDISTTRELSKNIEDDGYDPDEGYQNKQTNDNNMMPVTEEAPYKEENIFENLDSSTVLSQEINAETGYTTTETIEQSTQTPLIEPVTILDNNEAIGITVFSKELVDNGQFTADAINILKEDTTEDGRIYKESFEEFETLEYTTEPTIEDVEDLATIISFEDLENLKNVKDGDEDEAASADLAGLKNIDNTYATEEHLSTTATVPEGVATTTETNPEHVSRYSIDGIESENQLATSTLRQDILDTDITSNLVINTITDEKSIFTQETTIDEKIEQTTNIINNLVDEENNKDSDDSTLTTDTTENLIVLNTENIIAFIVENITEQNKEEKNINNISIEDIHKERNESVGQIVEEKYDEMNSKEDDPNERKETGEDGQEDFEEGQEEDSYENSENDRLEQVPFTDSSDENDEASIEENPLQKDSVITTDSIISSVKELEDLENPVANEGSAPNKSTEGLTTSVNSVDVEDYKDYSTESKENEGPFTAIYDEQELFSKHVFKTYIDRTTTEDADIYYIENLSTPKINENVYKVDNTNAVEHSLIDRDIRKNLSNQQGNSFQDIGLNGLEVENEDDADSGEENEYEEPETVDKVKVLEEELRNEEGDESYADPVSANYYDEDYTSSEGLNSTESIDVYNQNDYTPCILISNNDEECYLRGNISLKIFLGENMLTAPADSLTYVNCSHHKYHLKISWRNEEDEKLNNTAFIIIKAENNSFFIENVGIVHEDTLEVTKSFKKHLKLLATNISNAMVGNTLIDFENGYQLELMDVNLFIKQKITYLEPTSASQSIPIVNNITLIIICTSAACCLLFLVVGTILYKKLSAKTTIYKMTIE